MTALRLKEAHVNTLDAQRYGTMFSKMLVSCGTKESTAVLQALRELHLMFFVADIPEETVDAIFNIMIPHTQLAMAQ